MPESRLSRHALKLRKGVAIILVLTGLLTFVAGLSSWIVNAYAPFSSTVMIILGVLLLAFGIIVMIIERLESWLSHGQAALVDGLQAG
ncbi:MAG TPA: hypothetical protein VMU35_09320 [Methylomirabilota bacterium]|nr:hypothetical protein [Methylomirabilota bacterium]